MAKYKVISKGSLLTIKCRLSKKDVVNEREISYLTEHYTRGIFKIVYDGKKSLEYTAPMSLPLEKYLKGRILTEELFWKIIAQIVETARTVEINGLQPNNLWLDTRVVYINENTGELYIVYQPFVRMEAAFSALALIKDIVYEEAKKTGGNPEDYRVRFQQFLDMGSHYRLEEIGDYIESVYPRIYEKIGRRNSGRSGYLTGNISSYYKHYEQKDAAEEQGTVLLMESDTVVLSEEDENATVLLTNISYAKLVSKRTGKKVEIDRELFTLGKGSDNACCISENSAVSRKHAVISRKNGDYYIRDQKSTNGTYLNGRRLSENEEALLKDKDEIVLADEGFYIEIT